MKAFDRATLAARKAELEDALLAARDEFNQLVGAIRLVDALIAELDNDETGIRPVDASTGSPTQTEEGEHNP
jgi:hypothetical protein